MLIEDDRTMRTILKTLLELEQFTVSVWSGQPNDDIITLIREDKPDVLLLDVHLRSISGLDILRQIRVDIQLKSMRVLMTSGMDLKDQCLEAGAGLLQIGKSAHEKRRTHQQQEGECHLRRD